MIQLALSALLIVQSGSFDCTVRDRHGNCRSYGGNQSEQPWGDRVPEGGPTHTQGAGTR